ncbi:hypothetical protein PUN4_490047 [Paraburkholderia unamae]|nr:hypothetical protein PUN4_490047 [Paraburkholderia unamae]
MSAVVRVPGPSVKAVARGVARAFLSNKDLTLKPVRLKLRVSALLGFTTA